MSWAKFGKISHGKQQYSMGNQLGQCLATGGSQRRCYRSPTDCAATLAGLLRIHPSIAVFGA